MQLISLMLAALPAVEPNHRLRIRMPAKTPMQLLLQAQ
jgi:hypothetical protein